MAWPIRPPSIRHRPASPSNWPPTRRASFSACRCNVPNATTIPTGIGSVPNSGPLPRCLRISTTGKWPRSVPTSSDDESRCRRKCRCGRQSPRRLAGLTIPGTETIAPPVFLDGSNPPSARGPVAARALGPLADRAATIAGLPRPPRIGCGNNCSAADWSILPKTSKPPVPTITPSCWLLSLGSSMLTIMTSAICCERSPAPGSISFRAAPTPSSHLERHHFARMPLRRMTGEQLVDSLIQATGPARAAGHDAQPAFQCPTLCGQSCDRNLPNRTSPAPKAKPRSCKPCR